MVSLNFNDKFNSDVAPRQYSFPLFGAVGENSKLY